MSTVGPDQMMVTGSSFRNSYMKSEVDQAQVRGSFDFADYSRLDFGVSSTKVQNRTAYNFTQRDDWGGFGNGAADYADNLWIAARSEEHTSELQSLMRTSYADFCLK